MDDIAVKTSGTQPLRPPTAPLPPPPVAPAEPTSGGSTSNSSTAAPPPAQRDRLASGRIGTSNLSLPPAMGGQAKTDGPASAPANGGQDAPKTDGPSTNGPSAATNAAPNAVKTLTDEAGDPNALIDKTKAGVSLAKKVDHFIKRLGEATAASEGSAPKPAPGVSTPATGTPPAGAAAPVTAATAPGSEPAPAVGKPGTAAAPSMPSAIATVGALGGGIMGVYAAKGNVLKIEHGIEEAKNGHYAAAAAEVAGGGLGLVQNAGAVSEAVKVTSAATGIGAGSSVVAAASKVAGALGKAGPIMGMAAGAVQVGAALAHDPIEVGKAISGAASVAASGLMMTPPPGPAVGAALMIGVAVYDNWGAIKGFFGG
jgi:hypothetical protein